MDWRQAMGTGMVLSIVGFVFAFILHLYYIALEPSLILRGVKVGAGAAGFGAGLGSPSRGSGVPSLAIAATCCGPPSRAIVCSA